MTVATIRYLCTVTSKQIGDVKTWADYSFEYFEAIKAAGFVCRVLPIGIADVGDPDSRWNKHAAEFGYAVSHQYINVICGSTQAVLDCFTEKVHNVAITGAHPRAPQPPDIAIFDRLSAVVCAVAADVPEFEKGGIPAVHVAPQSYVMGRILREMLQ